MSSPGKILPVSAERPRWDDLEAFGEIANGIAAGKSLQQIADDPSTDLGGARMVYFRLGRLERVLGRRLVDRRPWGRQAYLTDAGRELAGIAAELAATRRRLGAVSAGTDVPVLRVVTHATLVSSLIPAVLQRVRGASRGRLPFHLELHVVSAYADALAAVNDARADIGLYLAFPRLDRAPTPRNMRKEILGSTDVVLLCPPTHRFAKRARGASTPVRLAELERETMIVRGYVDQQLLPAGIHGRRILVPHSLDKVTYVRIGLGLAILPRLIVDLLGPRAGVRVLPLHPPLVPSLTLLRPTKRLRPLSDAVERFLEDLRASSRSAFRMSDRRTAA